jgi:hypothetical protein
LFSTTNHNRGGVVMRRVIDGKIYDEEMTEAGFVLEEA